MVNIYRADRDYDIGPATDILVNDFDDERTLDEEEALEGHEDSHNELSNLQKVLQSLNVQNIVQNSIRNAQKALWTNFW